MTHSPAQQIRDALEMIIATEDFPYVDVHEIAKNALLLLPALEWRKDLPEYDMPVIVRTYSGIIFLARYQHNASMSDDETHCDQWQAEHEGIHPSCWTDGCCWSNNEDEIASDPVIEWLPQPPASKEGA